MGNVVITGGKSGLGLELAKAYEAAATIVQTVAALTPDQTCSFIRWDGSEHPW